MALKDIITNFFKKEEKGVPAVDSITELTREGAHKELTSGFLYKPPYGYPRYIDIEGIRNLATCSIADMAINAVIDGVDAVEWDIVTEDEKGNAIEGNPAEINHVRSFFENPNTNKESWNQLQRKFVRDILEIDAGVMIKVFNRLGEMVELTVRDGATFTKNPDIHGMYTYRDEIITSQFILNLEDTEEHRRVMDEFSQGELMTALEARERAAYFQYGWNTGSRPTPFGKREIVWFEKNARTHNHYGLSPLMVLYDTIQTLIYAIQHNLDYFKDNSIPLGVLGMDGANTEEVKAFKEQWESQQMKKDNLGRWKKIFHKLPIVNKVPVYVKFGFTNAELQLLEGQRWWAKLVWAAFGVTPSELGFTEDAAGMANQIIQSNVFKKRAINPILRLIEYHVNTQIIPEFEYKNLKFRFQRFDADEEMKKTQLYKLQIDTGIKTVNEIRNEQGLDDVEWGDDDPKRNQGNNFNMNMPGGNEMTRNSGKEMRKKEGSDQEGKAMNTDSPLILKPGEVLDEEKFKEGIIFLMRQKAKQIIELIQKEKTENQLSKIKQKSIMDIPQIVKDLFTMNELKVLSDETIKQNFMVGWESTEKQLARNIFLNKAVLTFLQAHTFENIMDMSEEIKNDLRAELERGIIGGESIPKLTARVEKVFDTTEARATAIARTEVNRAEGNGRLHAFKGSGLKGYKKKWVTHHDERTTPICKRLDGQVVGIEENFKDTKSGFEGPTNPAHVNCRSTVIYVPEEEI